MSGMHGMHRSAWRLCGPALQQARLQGSIRESLPSKQTVKPLISTAPRHPGAPAHLALQLSGGLQPHSRRLGKLCLLLHRRQLRLTLRQPACMTWRSRACRS